jgi:hypothetical protein
MGSVVLLVEDRTKVSATVDGAVRNRSLAYLTAILADRLRPFSENVGHDSRGNQHQRQHEQLLQHRSRNQLGPGLGVIRVCNDEEREHQNQNPEPKSQKGVGHDDLADTLVNRGLKVQVAAANLQVEGALCVGPPDPYATSREVVEHRLMRVSEQVPTAA